MTFNIVLKATGSAAARHRLASALAGSEDYPCGKCHSANLSGTVSFSLLSELEVRHVAPSTTVQICRLVAILRGV